MRHLTTQISVLTLMLTAPAGPALSQVTIGSLEVPAGETVVLDNAIGQQDMVLGRLIMGNASVLVIPDQFEHWHVYIQRAEIGEGARILARGGRGDNLTMPVPKPPRAPRCGRGHSPRGLPGNDSSRGETGHPGVPLTIFMGVGSVEGLLIDASGGDGGASGNGGEGGDAGRSDCTSNCTGGHGGRGGDARQSSGGNGGDINFYFWNADNPSVPPTTNIPGIRLLSKGGVGGAIGVPGRGGKGAVRRPCRWPVRNKPAQPDGLPGSRVLGDPGADGNIHFEGIVAPTTASVFLEDYGLTE